MVAPNTDLDPIYRATWQPIKFLLQCWWEQWLPQSSMATAMKATADHLATLNTPWVAIRGPFSAAWATLWRIGVRVTSMSEWTLPDGAAFNPTTVCISTVQRVLHWLCFKWQCKQ
eukprot:9492734-Pyramimonas_sp.AAC.1